MENEYELISESPTKRVYEEEKKDLKYYFLKCAGKTLKYGGIGAIILSPFTPYLIPTLALGASSLSLGLSMDNADKKSLETIIE